MSVSRAATFVDLPGDADLVCEILKARERIRVRLGRHPSHIAVNDPTLSGGSATFAGVPVRYDKTLPRGCWIMYDDPTGTSERIDP